MGKNERDFQREWLEELDATIDGLLKLRATRSDEYPRLAKTHYSVHGGMPTTITVKYEIETSKGPIDAFTLATQCIHEWQSFINSKCEGSDFSNAP
ncbi:MAG: hypothetical protein QOE96_4305 [Blastocatellia bacterium]|jgi:hypothetical protein|nr:hypothetical protein [Blastocatellia bacterium]